MNKEDKAVWNSVLSRLDDVNANLDKITQALVDIKEAIPV